MDLNFRSFDWEVARGVLGGRCRSLHRPGVVRLLNQERDRLRDEKIGMMGAILK